MCVREDVWGGLGGYVRYRHLRRRIRPCVSRSCATGKELYVGRRSAYKQTPESASSTKSAQTKRQRETNLAQPRRPSHTRSATPRSGASGHAGRPRRACARARRATRPLPTSNTIRLLPPPLLPPHHSLLRRTLRRGRRRRCRWRRCRSRFRSQRHRRRHRPKMAGLADVLQDGLVRL